MKARLLSTVWFGGAALFLSSLFVWIWPHADWAALAFPATMGASLWGWFYGFKILNGEVTDGSKAKGIGGKAALAGSLAVLLISPLLFSALHQGTVLQPALAPVIFLVICMVVIAWPIGVLFGGLLFNIKKDLPRSLPMVVTLPLLLALILVGRHFYSTSDVPCLLHSASLWPLEQGSTTKITVGRAHDSDCSWWFPGEGWRFSSSDSSVANISSDGTLQAVVPGKFKVTAARGTEKAGISGYILPKDFTVRVEPDAARIAVGETVKFMVRAYAKDGEQLPIVPYSISGSPREGGYFEPRPDFPNERWRVQWHVEEPVGFIGEKAGSYVMEGTIGGKIARATLIIRDKD